MSQKEIFTIGYEGAALEDFLKTLSHVDIDVLVDVRDVPASRKKGFSKSSLRDALKEVGIEYIHLKGLGDPKEGRDAARSGDMEKFKKIFSNHLKSEEAKLDMTKAIAIVQDKRACLLCFERMPDSCHRTIVAKKIANVTDQVVRALGVQKGLPLNAA